MKKLLVAAMMVVLPFPAFAAIQNVKVSGDITTTSVNLSGTDLGLTSATEFALTAGADGAPANTTGWEPLGLKRENDIITQTRVRIDSDLSDNVHAQVGLINERAWNAEGNAPSNGSNTSNPTGYDTNVQLYLANLTLSQFLYSPLTLEIGRQTFNFGNGFVMGGAGPSNLATGNLEFIDQSLTARTAYDGVNATLDYKPLTVNLIYFKNSQTNINGGYQQAVNGQDSDAFGYNLNYQLNDPWSTVVEQYMFARLDGGTISGGNKGNTLFVPGLRASTNPTKSLNIQAEVAGEAGDIVVANTVHGVAGVQQAEHREAMAAQLLATYSLPVLEKYKPTVNASYTYVSGDKDATENYPGDHRSSANTYTAWDQFNTVQGAGTIYRAIFPMTNEQIIEAGASIAPLEDVTASVTWSGLWDAARNGAQNPLVGIQPNTGTTTYIFGTKANKTYLGNETDVNLTYNYTEDVTFGLSFGWFVPGSVFSDVNKDTATQAIANVAVTF